MKISDKKDKTTEDSVILHFTSFYKNDNIII